MKTPSAEDAKTKTTTLLFYHFTDDDVKYL